MGRLTNRLNQFRRTKTSGAPFIEVEVEGERVVVDMPQLAEIPESERLSLSEQDLVGADFSDLNVIDFSATHCRFVECSFDRLRAEHASFGAGFLMSTYRECSFDGSRLSNNGLSFGGARFERCSFRDVHLTAFMGPDAEFVDCVFSGVGKDLIFNGSPHESLAQRLDEARTIQQKHPNFDPELAERIDAASRFLGDPLHDRATNEFTGNDLRDLDLIGVAFRDGIDLTKQRLPEDPDYVLLEDAGSAVDRARESVSAWSDDQERRRGLGLLGIYSEEVEDGQEQLLLRRSEFDDEVDANIFRLLTQSRGEDRA